MDFFSFVGQNWLHIIVVFSLVVVIIDLHFSRRRMNRFDKELKYTREIARELEKNATKN